MAQTVKNLPALRETWVRSLGWEDPLEKKMATHSSILAWRIPWTEEPGRLQSMGLQRVGHDWATFTLNIIISTCNQYEVGEVLHSFYHAKSLKPGVQYTIARQTIQHHHNPTLCPNHWCQRSLSWTVLWRPTTSSRTSTKKDVLFITGDWNAKVRSQEIPRMIGKFGLGVQNEAGQRLTEFCQENALVIANTLFQQPKRSLHMDITRWSVVKSDYVLCSQRWRSSIQWAKTRPGADCGSIISYLLQNSGLNGTK